MPVAVESWFLKTAEPGRAEDVHLLARTWGARWLGPKLSVAVQSLWCPF